MARADALGPGARFLGRYEVVSELGAGSFGRVYKAIQLSTGQLVAIKTLRVRDDDPGADLQYHRERLRREMRMGATLSHPHIVRLIDFGDIEGEGEGRLFAVFELVPGLTLRALLDRDGALPEADAVRLMAQVLDALACAHSQGIVHRDLKPENIMVASTGLRRNAMVLDFGLGVFTGATEARARPRLTATGEMMGTPCYAAPEQLRGQPPSALSDIYSWGLIFVECLTGRIAVDGATGEEVLMKQLGPDPIPIPDALRGRRLGRLLAAVTVKDPSERRVSVAGILDTLAMIERESVHAILGRGEGPEEGERRQLTLVSLRLNVARRDGSPAELEDLDQARSTMHVCCERLATESGGVVAGPAGDRVVVTFGYPRAQENDARRAVHAALRITGMAAREIGLGDHLSAHVRAGVASGVVIVRDHGLTAGGARFDLVGSAPEVAIALDTRAAAGEVLIDAETLRLLRGRFHVEVADDVEAGGVRQAAFRVREAVVEPSRSSDPSMNDSPLVGRDIELSQLVHAWRRAEEGEPTILLVVGEPGIGKSRLVRELRRQVPTQAWLEARCAPETRTSPLRPVIDLLHSLGEPIESLLVRHDFDLEQTLPLLASLLSLPLDDRFAPLRISAERAKELTLAAISSLVLRIASERPCVLAIEDLQWADATTLDLLALLTSEMRAAETSGAVPLCLVLSARPEFEAGWTGEAKIVTPEKLARRDIEKLVAALVPAGAAPDADVLRRIVERADGVPLFVEELTRVISKDAGARGRPHVESEIPTTLRALLTTRLDALSTSARETAQLAATLGRTFRSDVLEAAAGKDEWVLRQDVDELIDARLLYRRRSSGDYVFKHALVRDTAYDSMVRPVRRRAHERIAKALLENLPEVVQHQPEVVAQHLEAAEALPEAAEYWYRAGDRALRRAAYAEARQQLERGLAVIARMPQSETRRRAEVETLITLGTVLFNTQGYGASEVEQTFARALPLCEEIERGASAKILSGIVGVYITRGNSEATERLLPQFQRMAEREDDKVACVTGETTLGLVAFWRGEHASAELHFERACAAYRTPVFREFARDYGYDGGLFCYGYRVWNLWVLGRAETAERVYEELAELGETSFDPYAQSLALSFGMVIAYGRRDAEATAARSERLIEVANEQRAYLLLGLGLCGRGGAATLAGRPQDAIPEISQGFALLQMAGAVIAQAHYSTFLAEAQLAAGQIDDGLATVEQGLELCAGSMARFPQPELLRLKAALLEKRGAAGDAIACYRQGLELARASAAAAYELRCAAGLARLLGAGAEEGTLALRAAYARFQEGLDLPELRDAACLLAELGGKSAD